jgi:hypothetical protein
MPQTGHYLFGLVMFCLAVAFTIGLGSFLQQAAIARQQEATASVQQAEIPVVNLPPEGSYYRKASF